MIAAMSVRADIFVERAEYMALFYRTLSDPIYKTKTTRVNSSANAL